ncbi:response regulator [Aureimonas populi]|uniref:Response regulator n=1 Tax=Aureimonas populi TaxID=1701758 RepID=A0ABW5CKV8_9HYPH|nr:response regulator [Aureimonas populi]
MTSKPSLAGRQILLVEDEFMIAMDIEAELVEAGAQVVCAGRLEEAEKLAQTVSCHAAILDLDLHGKTSFPVADRLEERGIPFLFHTGHGVRENLKTRYPHTLVCNKPCDISDLVRSLGELVPAS